MHQRTGRTTNLRADCLRPRVRDGSRHESGEVVLANAPTDVFRRAGEFPLRLSEPPIRVELRTYGLRNPRCRQCFQEVRVPVDQPCPLERIAVLVEELEKLIRRCPTCPTCPTER